MIRILLDMLLFLALWLVLIAAALFVGEKVEGPAQSLFVQADYSKCITIKNAPLLKPKGIPLGNAQSEIS